MGSDEIRKKKDEIRNKRSGLVLEIDPSIQLPARRPGPGIERKLHDGASSPNLALSDVGKASVNDSFLQSSLGLQQNNISALIPQPSKIGNY